LDDIFFGLFTPGTTWFQIFYKYILLQLVLQWRILYSVS